MDKQRENNLREYAQIKAQIAELEEKQKELQPFIIDLLDESGGKPLGVDGIGLFYFNERTTWEYSSKVTELEKKLKDLKKIEELKKIAVPKSISRALCFKKNFQQEESTK